MAIVFPPTPSLGQKFPANPGLSGVTQYEWSGTRWNAVLSTVSLGALNQGVFNNYKWPAADGTAGKQLTTDGLGSLTWDVPAAPNLQVLTLLEVIDGTSNNYTLVESGTTTPFTPNPSTNIVVFLGGVPQIPTAAYTVAGANINFPEAPKVGSTFYAISSVVS